MTNENILDALEPVYLVSQFKKNGISLEEVKTILRNDVGVNRKAFEDQEPSPAGNDKTMLVGFSKPNRLIEVGIEWETGGEGNIVSVIVHHAMKVSKPYGKAYYED